MSLEITSFEDARKVFDLFEFSDLSVLLDELLIFVCSHIVSDGLMRAVDELGYANTRVLLVDILSWCSSLLFREQDSGFGDCLDYGKKKTLDVWHVRMNRFFDIYEGINQVFALIDNQIFLSPDLSEEQKMYVKKYLCEEYNTTPFISY